MLGLDSEYDYDPVWAKCVELGVAPTFHTVARGDRAARVADEFHPTTISDISRVAGEAVCKALFMGGVTRRFPTLKIAFLEGGVGWACSCYGGPDWTLEKA